MYHRRIPREKMRFFFSGWLYLTCLLCAAGTTSCQNEVPAPWKGMRFPLSNGEVLPGADAQRLQVSYRNLSAMDDLFREYRHCLEHAGFAFEGEGKDHEPASRIYSAIFKKGPQRILLQISAGRGTTVQVKFIND